MYEGRFLREEAGRLMMDDEGYLGAILTLRVERLGIGKVLEPLMARGGGI